MARRIVTQMAVGLLVLIGCGPAEPELATEIGDIAGTWESFRGASEVARQRQTLEITADGEITNRRYSSSGTQLGSAVGAAWFEQGTMFIEHEACAVGEIGSYEVYLLADGKIRFVPIEDDCTPRREDWAGPGENPSREWSPTS